MITFPLLVYGERRLTISLKPRIISTSSSVGIERTLAWGKGVP
ncbi:hypothetical protein [Richelia intracellularis]